MTDEEMLELLTSGDKAMMETWAGIIQFLREQNSLADIATALEQGRHQDAIRGLETVGERLAQEWIKQFSIAALAEAALADRFVTYDATNALALQALTARRLELVTTLSRDVRELVQSVVSRGLYDGSNPLEMARTIRDSLGLTAGQESAVASYERALRLGNFADARRRQLRDGRFDARMRRGRELTDEQVDQMVSVYRRNMVTFRAETISRDVALTALHEGSEELFRQAFESGQLSPEEIVVTWSSALRATTRDSHRAMHGQERAPGESFTSGNGYALRYPGDPRAPASERLNCLCVLQRRMRPKREVALALPIR